MSYILLKPGDVISTTDMMLLEDAITWDWVDIIYYGHTYTNYPEFPVIRRFIKDDTDGSVIPSFVSQEVSLNIN